MKQRTIIALIVTIFSGIVLAAPPYTPDAETILLYHFDESAGSGLPQDSSFYTNNATSGPLATGDTGIFGNAMAFTNTSISIPDDPSFEKVQTNGTVEFWIKFSADAIDQWGGETSILRKNAGGNNKGDFSIGYRMNPIAYGGASINMLMETGEGTYRSLKSPNLITDTNWHHIVVSWDSVTKPTITVDDASQSLSDNGTDASYVGPIFPANVPLTVGALNSPGGFILLDELRLLSPEPPPPTGTLIIVH